MSYSATISFKKIKPEEIFDFFIKIKEKVKENLEKIAEDEFIFSPYSKNAKKYRDSKYDFDFINDNTEWAKRIFTYRYFYHKELNLLGIYGLPNSLRELFDDTLGFQDSCDQDYEFEYWDKVEPFKLIADKWRTAPLESALEKMDRLSDLEYCKDIEKGSPQYYTKTACYEEIWETYLEKTLYSEDSIVYLSLFQHYDSSFIHKFIYKVKELYDLFIEGCKKNSNKERE